MRLHFVKRPRLGIVLRPRKVALYSVGSEVSPFYLHGRRYAAPTYLSCFSFRLMTVSNVFGVVAVISICSFFFFECGRFFAFSSFARSDIPTRLLCSVWYFRRFILLLRVFFIAPEYALLLLLFDFVAKVSLSCGERFGGYLLRFLLFLGRSCGRIYRQVIGLVFCG